MGTLNVGHSFPEVTAAVNKQIEFFLHTGFIIPPINFVQAVSEFCNEYGIVFVEDEIQTGFSRTGAILHCFGFNHSIKF